MSVCIRHFERSWQKILLKNLGDGIQTKVLIWHCRHPHGLFSMFSLALGHAETCEKQGLGLIVDWTGAQCGLPDVFFVFVIYHVFAVCLQFRSLQFLSRCQLVLRLFQLVFRLHIRVLGCLMRTSTELLYRGPPGEPNVWSSFFMQPAEIKMTSKVMIDSEMVRDVERWESQNAPKSYKVHFCLPWFARQFVMQFALDSNLPVLLGHFRKMHPDVATRCMPFLPSHIEVYGNKQAPCGLRALPWCHSGKTRRERDHVADTDIYIYMILLQWSSCKRILNSGMMFHQIRKDQVE